MTDIDPLENPNLDAALGGLRRGEGDRVYHPDSAIVIHEDGEFIEPVQKAKNRREKARMTLWGRVGPLRYGDLELSYRTEVWHDDRDEWWVAEEVNIYGDGEPEVTFRAKGTDPAECVRVLGSQLAELVSDGVLRSKQAVNDEVETLLEEHRAGVTGEAE